MVNKDEVLARALKYHSKTGRVVTALYAVFAANYPAGTNLVLKFAEMFKGLPYGHTNMCMDKKIDCAEFWRIIFYIWFGIDIGNNSDAVYYNKLGVTITTDYRELGTKCQPLDLTFYHTNSRKKTGHVSGIFDAARQLMSGAAVNLGKVGFTGFKWHSEIFMCAKRYLTDEHIASVTVQAADVTPAAPAGPITTAPAAPVAPAVKKYKYGGATYCNIRDKVNGKAIGKVWHGNVVEFLCAGSGWWKIETENGLIGWVEKIQYFKEV